MSKLPIRIIPKKGILHFYFAAGKDELLDQVQLYLEGLGLVPQVKGMSIIVNPGKYRERIVRFTAGLLRKSKKKEPKKREVVAKPVERVVYRSEPSRSRRTRVPYDNAPRPASQPPPKTDTQVQDIKAMIDRQILASSLDRERERNAEAKKLEDLKNTLSSEVKKVSEERDLIKKELEWERKLDRDIKAAQDDEKEIKRGVPVPASAPPAVSRRPLPASPLRVLTPPLPVQTPNVPITSITTPAPAKRSRLVIDNTGRGKGKHLPSGASFVTNEKQINDLLVNVPSYKGTYSIDQLGDIPPARKGDVSAVVNTDVSSGPGVHWLAVWLTPKHIEIFDSLAEMSPLRPVQLQGMINTLRKKYKHPVQVKLNNVRDQRSNSSTCGYFSAKFILDRNKGDNFKKASGWSSISKAEQEVRKLHFEP